MFAPIEIFNAELQKNTSWPKLTIKTFDFFARPIEAIKPWSKSLLDNDEKQHFLLDKKIEKAQEQKHFSLDKKIEKAQEKKHFSFDKKIKKD